MNGVGGRIPVAAAAEELHDLAGGLILPLSEKTASETQMSRLNTFTLAYYILSMNKISRRAKLRTVCHLEQIHKCYWLNT